MIQKQRTYSWIITIVSFAGMLNAAYLTQSHYAGNPVVCNVLHGCETVLTSAYATVGPIPVALLGLIFYLAVFLVSVAWLRYENSAIVTWLWRLTAIGIAVSAFFVAIQALVIEAWCQYCLISATEATILFIAATLLS